MSRSAQGIAHNEGPPVVVVPARRSTRLKRGRTAPNTSNWRWNLPDELTVSVLRRLGTLATLANAARVSQSWRAAASSSALWNQWCDRVWATKVHIDSESRELRAGGQPRRALQNSFDRGADRFIAPELLSELRWYFRFKGSAGDTWTSQDPWWNGEEARSLQFGFPGAMACSAGSSWSKPFCSAKGEVLFKDWGNDEAGKPLDAV